MKQEIDFERLSTYLKALAHPARLEILWRLRIPAAASDIVVKPRRRDEGLQQERAMSRQSIMEHIEHLEDIGVVTRAGEDGYVTSAQHLFALVEDIRALSAIETARAVDVDATMAQQPGPESAAKLPAGPKLVLVAGPWEGRAFALAGAGPWTIGRATTQSVALTYDPFASGESARIARSGDAHSIEGVAGARNPPQLNFMPLTKPRALAPGDVLGVGRSLLVFQPR